MKTEAHVQIRLTSRDVRLASANNGIDVELPPNTTRILLVVEREEDEQEPAVPR